MSNEALETWMEREPATPQPDELHAPQPPAPDPTFDFTPLDGNHTIRHGEVLAELLQQVQRVDFEAEANPNNADNFRLSRNHYVILTIEKILKLAEVNKWGLCKNNGFVYLFNGEYWSIIEEDTLKTFLGEAAEAMGVPQFTARYYDFRDILYKQFQSQANLQAPDSDNTKVLINLQNGTFEVTTVKRELREFDCSDFITHQLPFRYNENATAPLFGAYLDRVLPDKDRQKVLSEYMGYLFIRNGGGLKLEKALILYGTGANGKSVFFEIVNALLGSDNVSSYSLQSLTDASGYYRAKLGNKLVNYASEINGKLETSIFKQLVSGEPVEARLPYGEPFMQRNYAKLIFNCNELPKDIEHTEAFFRRFLIVPFDITIPAEEQNPNLSKEIIENELSGVFNWVLQGVDRLLKQQGFTPCEAAAEAVNRFRTESDSVAMFLSESGYKCSNRTTEPLKEIYRSYTYYCNDSGYRPCSKITFSDRMRGLGYVSKRSNAGMEFWIEKESQPEIWDNETED